MSTPKKPKKPKGDKTHPPAGPPLMEDIPTPKMHERPHSPAAAIPPEGETKWSTDGRTPPPVGPPPLEDTPTPKMPVRPHSPAAADPPEGETQPVAANYGKAKPPEH